ncbi:MAG TPA: 1-deoxy-D-xylulose-5-phosphate reductoisomerase [Phycisphaerae bacterium]|nr:1-deoxy-D-xylulose-5-phosphate reductoisomerase [Phycisphaerae bacterium]
MNRIILLGSTGSIGTSAVQVIRELGADYRVVGLSAGSSWSLLAEQAEVLAPEAVALADESSERRLTDRIGRRCRVLVGPTAAADLVEQLDCDVVLAAIVGAAGLPATLAAVERGRRVALANKEALVVAGSLLVPLARLSGARLVPVDSEHSAIFQALQAGRPEEVRRIYLTASGGPFYTWSAEQIAAATLEQALEHPTWDMGPKITIDSATMMNKALEIVEACWLFGVPAHKIEVVIHPESIVHSMVEFCDGSVIAQMGTPDMRTPIQYALTYPQRRPCCSRRLEIGGIGTMRFEQPDHERFGALRLGYEVARKRGTAGAVLNAANEAAVELFRAGRIRFGDITALTASALSAHEVVPNPSLEQLLSADGWARRHVAQLCVGRADPVQSRRDVS